MNLEIHSSWKHRLQNEFDKPYFKDLLSFVTDEYHSHQCFPPENEIFNAFNFCSFNDVKVVIIGQDPYHDIGQANGLCFSVSENVKHPPSLINIFKEIETDIGNPYPESGDLTHWSKQGVLLLNATLTVRAHQAGSHQKKGWEQFTDAIIKVVSEKKENIVFLLWGGFAKKKEKLIDKDKHYILTSGHPSPLSANRGYWFGNKCFSKTNLILKKIDKKLISW
ncbi:uracil-DNA glycosylase [Thalassobellus suaedae]|uniref:Uracil-DNA glycosylase n=1 Tax=Thalassobellus suaedae TaxID=3074124 RepID=A0ABY9XW26_9FLAO|nr:uracil-DNA glycosylase [Flavobacteriaceae bacterium HL-DH14]WNH12152.1 uracil-DNA glycosylase [Flavobacteriaceae bacterium HL-DH10]